MAALNEYHIHKHYFRKNICETGLNILNAVKQHWEIMTTLEKI